MTFNIHQLTLNVADTLVCKDLTIRFNKNEICAVLGVNGVGKSSLLHHMIDCSSTSARQIVIDETPLNEYQHHRKKLAQKTGILLQEYEYYFPCTVLEAVLIGRHPYLSQWQWETQHDIEIAEYALRQTGLFELKERMIDTLSGGEKRRLNLATLFTQDPDYYLLDEPTNHLDLHAQITMLDLLKKHIQQKNKTAIMVIHDANLAYRYCDTALMLFGDGHWAYDSTKKLINPKNLERLYGCPITTLSNQKQTVFIPA
ncbi:MAG TPA: ABC transporter ATP-binding protein [Gammaproteobacteria bacterium]|nr:ABC transporter ATP-binding protein [Gammaproteobacteria bacterium]